MSRRLRTALSAGVCLVVLGVIYVMNFGLYPQYFDIAWDEEVQLHDGRVIVVHVKRTFERRGLRLARYDEINSTFRRNEFVFDANEKAGVVTFSTRMPVAYLGEIGGYWYAVISGQGPYGNFEDEMPNRWGDDFTNLEQRLAVLSGSKFLPLAWDRAPSELTRMNLLSSIPLIELVALNDQKVSLAMKTSLEDAHPSSYRNQISRPLRMTQNQGDKK